MKRTIIKVIINLSFITYFLILFWNTFRDIALLQSVDAAAGFLMGLIFMAVLWIVIKCVNFLYSDFVDWLERRKHKKRIGLLSKKNI